MKLAEIKINKNEIFKPSVNIMQDLHSYVNYVLNKSIKRTHRDNQLPKADHNRLIKLMITQNDPDYQVFFPNTWLDFVEALAREMGLVSFDTKGVYMGYYSMSPSYPDNYIKVSNAKYMAFIDQKPIQQEQNILDTLLKNSYPCQSELYRSSILGRLDRFLSYGCNSSLPKQLNYEKSRQTILNVLKNCQSNVWYSTQSLIAYLKKNDPFFLIPNHLRKNKEYSTYGSFTEFKHQTNRKAIAINETDKDAFERVEGRFIERFLEGIPLIMNYVELAYEMKESAEIKPSLNMLKAFKVNDYFFRIVNKQLPDPDVWIQPNFEIQVISELYPGGLLATLSRFADMMKTDGTVSILKLNRKKVLNEKLENESLDIVALLQKMSKREIAQNVVTEITGWCAQSEIFTLYKHVGLLETQSKKTQDLHNCKLAQVSPTIQVIDSPDDVFKTLEQNEKVPILIQHGQSKLKSIADNTRSVFSEKNKKNKKGLKEKQSVTIKQQTFITLFFSLKNVFEEFQKRLIQARCPVESDSNKQTLTIPGKHETFIKDIVKDLKKEYQIRFE